MNRPSKNTGKHFVNGLAVVMCSAIYLLLAPQTMAQEFGWSQIAKNEGRFVRDSTVWYCESMGSVGDTTCQHSFASEFGVANPSYGCLVFHNGGHCSMMDRIENKICRKCLRKERWRESVYEHFELNPKTEYQKLEEEMRRKQSK